MLFLLRFLSGYVCFRITGSRAGSFVNKLIRAHINVWGIRADSDGIVCCVRLRDYPTVQSMCRDSSQRVRIKAKRGVPFFLHKNRDRSGLLVGAVLFLAVFHVLSLFVWTVDICEFNTISQTAAREILGRVGLYEGVYGELGSLKRMQTTAMLEFGNLSWMTINVDGSRGEVNATEKIPEETNDTAPRNMKAAIDGQIVRADAYCGDAFVSAGDAVVKGDLLISGVVETELGGVRIVRADGTVIARTHREEKFAIPKKRRAAEYTDTPVCRYAARLFGVVVPLTFCSAPQDRAAVWSEVSAEFGGERASVSLITENIYGRRITVKDTDCETVFKNECLLRELFCYNDKKILNKQIAVSENDNYMIYTVDYSCEENIAKPSKILVRTN